MGVCGVVSCLREVGLIGVVGGNVGLCFPHACPGTNTTQEGYKCNKEQQYVYPVHNYVHKNIERVNRKIFEGNNSR